MADQFRPYYSQYATQLNKAMRAPPSMIFLWGTYSYLHSRAIEKLKNNWLKKQADCRPIRISADGLKSADQIENLWQQPSMFEPSSLYIIEQVEQAKSLPKIWAKLSPDLKAPLILSSNSSGITTWKKELTRLKGIAVPCFAPNERDFPGVLHALNKKHGLKLTSQALKLIHDQVGEDLSQLDNEFRTLALIFPNSQGLNEQNIAPFLGTIRQDHVFALTSFILKHKYAAAQELVHQLCSQGESALSILGILSRHIRLTISLASAPPQETIKGLPSFLRGDYSKYLQGISPAGLWRCLGLCQDIDMSLKSSNLAEDLALAQVIVQLSELRKR